MKNKPAQQCLGIMKNNVMQALMKNTNCKPPVNWKLPNFWFNHLVSICDTFGFANEYCQ